MKMSKPVISISNRQKETTKKFTTKQIENILSPTGVNKDIPNYFKRPADKKSSGVAAIENESNRKYFENLVNSQYK